MKKMLAISLILALMMSLVLTPAAATAGPLSFSGTGSIYYISEGDASSPETVLQCGSSDNWHVTDRIVKGTFDEDGNVSGDFTMVYSGVFKMNYEKFISGNSQGYQSGNFYGSLTMDDNSAIFKLNGKVSPMSLTPVGYYPVGNDMVPIMELAITGSWNLQQGGTGNGDFNASIKFVPTPDGHIYFVVPNLSHFTMTGKYK